MEGVADLDNTATDYKFALEQNFIGASVDLRYRPVLWGQWSVMGGAEFSKGTSVTLKVLSGPGVDTSDIQLPYYMIFSGTVFI